MWQMVSMNFCAAHLWDAPDIESSLRLLAPQDESQTDWRLVFSADCRAAFARPSRYTVNRNVRFVDGPVNHFDNVFGPGGAAEGEADPGESVSMDPTQALEISKL